MKFVLLVSGLFPLIANAQFESHGTKLYESEGQLVTLRIVPADGSAKIYLVGKKVVEIGHELGPKLVAVTQIGPDRRQVLQFKPADGGYVFKLPTGKNSTIRIRARLGTREEDLDLKMEKP